jgi:phage-related protein (TIGR01555 family)
MFEIDGDGGPRPIHPSRVICFRGEPLPAGAALSAEDAFWGDARLLRVWREAARSDETQQWFAALVRKAKLLRVGIPNLSDLVATAEGQARLNARVALIAEGEHALNAVVYDAGAGKDDPGEAITDYQITWAGIPTVMDAFDQRLAAVSDIPFTRLMGRSPAGLNATGAHDTDNWLKMVVAGQKLELRPCLEQLDPFLIRSAGVEAEGEVTWRFAPLDTPSAQEQAATFKTTMEAAEKLKATAAIPPEAFARGLQNLMAEREWMPGLEQALEDVDSDPATLGEAPTEASD